jgi:hypothetical protein
VHYGHEYDYMKLISFLSIINSKLFFNKTCGTLWEGFYTLVKKGGILYSYGCVLSELQSCVVQAENQN